MNHNVNILKIRFTKGVETQRLRTTGLDYFWNFPFNIFKPQLNDHKLKPQKVKLWVRAV